MPKHAAIISIVGAGACIVMIGASAEGILPAIAPYFRAHHQNRLFVVNQSEQEIKHVSVTVYGKTIRIENIPAGASLSSPFHSKTDDHFSMKAEMEDGTVLVKDCGYVTGGMYGERVTFCFLPNGEVKFTQGRD